MTHNNQTVLHWCCECGGTGETFEGFKKHHQMIHRRKDSA